MITVNVTNKPGRAIAQDVTTEVRSISGGQTTVVSSQASGTTKNGPRREPTTRSRRERR